MNKPQKSFLNNLLKSIKQAEKNRDDILFAMTIGVRDEQTCNDYVKSLEEYINSTNKMVMKCRMAFGEASDRIALNVIVSQESDN